MAARSLPSSMVEDGSSGSMPGPAGSSARSPAAASTDSPPSFPGRSRLLRRLSGGSQGQCSSSGADGVTRIPPSGTESPMTRSPLIIAAAAVAVAVAVGGFVAYDQVLRGDSAAALTLPTASTASSVPAASAPTGGSDAPAASTGTSAASAGDVAGTWNVAADSVAGYRVREQLANLPAESDAVGRTDQVTGSITLESSGSTTTLTAGALTVDTTSITSDKSQRDNRLRDEGLQTDQFPTATFTLTKPVEIPAEALAGTASDVTLTAT